MRVYDFVIDMRGSKVPADVVWGFIPTFLLHNDPRGVREQFNERYVSGWRPFKGFTLNPETYALSYEGDPDMNVIATMTFCDELIHIYPHAWVVVMQKDGSWEVCRMD